MTVPSAQTEERSDIPNSRRGSDLYRLNFLSEPRGRGAEIKHTFVHGGRQSAQYSQSAREPIVLVFAVKQETGAGEGGGGALFDQEGQ